MKAARITEVGAILYDWDTKFPLKMYSEFLWDTDYPVSPPELIELTGITDDVLQKRGIKPVQGLKELSKIMMEAHFIVAHNGTGFDQPLLMAEFERHGLPTIEKQWIDTRTDIVFPSTIKARKLSHLAAEHGFVNPFPHRAIFDVTTMMKVLSYYNIDEVIKLSREPLIHSVAKVSYEDRQKAKDNGYYWDGENKKWFRPMKDSQFEAEKERVPFHVIKVQVPK